MRVCDNIHAIASSWYRNATHDCRKGSATIPVKAKITLSTYLFEISTRFSMRSFALMSLRSSFSLVVAFIVYVRKFFFRYASVCVCIFAALIWKFFVSKVLLSWRSSTLDYSRYQLLLAGVNLNSGYTEAKNYTGLLQRSRMHALNRRYNKFP
jgi:hypothetical protein